MGYRFPYFRYFWPGGHLVPHRLLQSDGGYRRSAALYHLFQADQSGLRRGKRIVIENYIKKQPVCKRLHSVRRMPDLQTGLFFFIPSHSLRVDSCSRSTPGNILCWWPLLPASISNRSFTDSSAISCTGWRMVVRVGL